MSLYTRLFAENPVANELLSILKLGRADFGRFRDIFASQDGKTIMVITRIGGKNRPYFRDIYHRLGMHPWIESAKDEHDTTYHDIYFHVPESWWLAVKSLNDGSKPLNASERFDKLNHDEEAGYDTADVRRSEIFAQEFLLKLEALTQTDDSVGAFFDTDTPEDLKPPVETIEI